LNILIKFYKYIHELISGFHRALLQSLLLADQMHLIIQNLEVKIYVV